MENRFIYSIILFYVLSILASCFQKKEISERDLTESNIYNAAIIQIVDSNRHFFNNHQLHDSSNEVYQPINLDINESLTYLKDNVLEKIASEGAIVRPIDSILNFNLKKIKNKKYNINIIDCIETNTTCAIISFSKIYFNTEFDEAYFSYEISKDQDFAKSDLVFMKLRNKNWYIFKIVNLWIS